MQLQLHVNQKARNLLSDVETKVVFSYLSSHISLKLLYLLGKTSSLADLQYVVSNLLQGLKNFAWRQISQREQQRWKIIGITKANDKSRPLLSRFDEFSKQPCAVSIALVCFLIYKGVTKEMWMQGCFS